MDHCATDVRTHMKVSRDVGVVTWQEVRVSQQILLLEPGYLIINITEDNQTLSANPNPSLLSHAHPHITRCLCMGSHICCVVGPSIQVDPGR